MKTMACLPVWTKEDLIILLTDCAHHLHHAYQITLEKALFDAAHDANSACEYLRFKLQASEGLRTLH